MKSNHHQVKAAKGATAPVVHRPNHLWWSTSYHMKSPIERLEPGTRLVVAVKDQGMEVVAHGGRAVVFWSGLEGVRVGHDSRLREHHELSGKWLGGDGGGRDGDVFGALVSTLVC